MADSILFVDDEENILNSLERLFREDKTKILKATNAQDALKFFTEDEIALVVSDNLMPGMNGVDFLSIVQEISPYTVKILMTAHADLATAIDAINRGNVFKFIVKPWRDKELVEIVEDGMNRYKIVGSLRKANEATLRSIAQTIELKDPYTRGHCDRVAEYALKIADTLSLTEETKKELKYGSWLHDCGKIGVPEKILNHNGSLTEKEFAVIKNHPRWGADVAREAHLSDVVVNIVLHHHERYNGCGYPLGISGADIPLEARIVAVADTFDAIITDRPYRKGESIEKAIEILSSKRGEAFDPDIVEVFLSLVKEETF